MQLYHSQHCCWFFLSSFEGAVVDGFCLFKLSLLVDPSLFIIPNRSKVNLEYRVLLNCLSVWWSWFALKSRHIYFSLTFHECVLIQQNAAVITRRRWIPDRSCRRRSFLVSHPSCLARFRDGTSQSGETALVLFITAVITILVRPLNIWTSGTVWFPWIPDWIKETKSAYFVLSNHKANLRKHVLPTILQTADSI